MLSYEWDEGEPLSARGDDSTGQLTERRNHTLLRPIYINAVEVGYAYTQCDKDKRLNVRGVTIALWYFISKGHQTVAMLPYCFKTYPDKSSSWPELMALFKMNLIEFTPGYGSEKYTEVNRILANRAADTGGCIVARSQMHNIIEERPTLDRTVEKRLRPVRWGKRERRKVYFHRDFQKNAAKQYNFFSKCLGNSSEVQWRPIWRENVFGRTSYWLKSCLARHFPGEWITSMFATQKAREYVGDAFSGCLARQMAREHVGDTFFECLARQMAEDDVDDPFSGTSTYDASGLEWMCRFSCVKFEVRVAEQWRTMSWISQLLPIQVKIFYRKCLRNSRRTALRSARSAGSSGLQRHQEMHDVV
ncbi:hypothetical protein Y032_0113g367 [Ancylostoma ceylanicum]|uniref:RNase NYN domain-containing protein n=1 Tax=Ancylostoma ceylanicum TaxID=53326 RepID=A0A016TDG2_9BILA|nr:hypothetical protein Y032_0113g367 [Ancylostoma ceylanicum]